MKIVARIEQSPRVRLGLRMQAVVRLLAAGGALQALVAYATLGELGPWASLTEAVAFVLTRLAAPALLLFALFAFAGWHVHASLTARWQRFRARVGRGRSELPR